MQHASKKLGNTKTEVEFNSNCHGYRSCYMCKDVGISEIPTSDSPQLDAKILFNWASLL